MIYDAFRDHHVISPGRVPESAADRAFSGTVLASYLNNGKEVLFFFHISPNNREGQEAMKCIKSLFTFFIILCIASIPALGQAVSGSIVGKVVDASGGVLPGVEISVTSQASGRVFNTLSSDVGTFTVRTWSTSDKLKNSPSTGEILSV
jgi:hypothetical protein